MVDSTFERAPHLSCLPQLQMGRAYDELLLAAVAP